MNIKLKQSKRHPEFISGSNRHCERSEAISSRLPRPHGLAMTNETGRSMVEMLGVLAVIGVLSITGISGYTTAMNKHRANEILDAASKRAVVISTQLQSGRTNPTLAEFGEDATVQGVSFSLKATNGNDWATGQERFAIQTSAIDEDICREIYNITGTSGTVREMYSDSNALSSSSGCSDTASAMRFVYNNDLTNTAITSDYKDSASCTAATKKWCSGWTTPGCSEDCCSGKSEKCCNASTGKLASASTTCDLNSTNDGVCNATTGICEVAAVCDGTVANLHNCTVENCATNGGKWISSAPTPFCAKLFDDGVDWCTARTTKCGGIEHMVSAADLGCTTIYGSECSVTELGTSPIYWVSDCYDETCTNSSTCDSGYAFMVDTFNGHVRADDRNNDVGYALCK